MMPHIDRRSLPTINDRGFRNLLDRLQHTNEGPVFFVEIGAYDGVAGDPVYHKAIEYQWSGLLIEPIKDYFERLRENYAANPNVILENVAIDREHGSRAMYRKGNLSSTSLVRNLNFDTGQTTEELVRVITLQSVLQKHSIRQIDLLQVDAEGKDIEIIEDFDFETYFPAVINFEANVLSEPHRVNSLLNKLAGLGYALYNHSWHQAESDITATILEW